MVLTESPTTNRKRGSLFDISIIMFVFVAIVIAGLMMNTILAAISSDPGLSFQINNTFNDGTNKTNNTAARAALNLANRQTREENGGTDNMIVTFFFLSHISIIILAAIIPTSIIFIFITFFFVMLNIVLGYIVTNISTPLFAGFGINLVYSRWLLEHIIAIELGYSILIVIVMFIAGYRNQAGGGGV